MILWADMNAQGSLIASDTRPARMQILRETMREAGIPERLAALDATRPLPFGPDTFDRVFVDVPCSGLGTLRRDPDVKWAVTRESLPGLAATQRRILSHAASVVRPGGTVIYATCSSEPDENDEVVDAFLADSPSFAGEAIDPAAGLAELIDERGRLRTTPSRHRLDAFFAARLVRRDRA
jgi:16S rRNA (cytosine967-C5)-methyltransferase